MKTREFAPLGMMRPDEPFSDGIRNMDGNVSPEIFHLSAIKRFRHLERSVCTLVRISQQITTCMA